MARSSTKRRQSAPSSGGGFHFKIESIPAWIAMIATLSTLAGFYYSTTYSINDLKSRTEHDDKARESLREVLTKNTEKTSEAIADLTKHAAVQDERTQNITSTLQSIQGQLSNIATSVSPAGVAVKSREGK